MLVLATPLGAMAESAQSQSNGLVADASWNVLMRTVYERRDYKNGDLSNGARNRYLPRDQRSDHAKEWGAGLMASLESGYTQGLVGVGFDGFLYGAQKLDGSDYTFGKIRLLPVDGEGYAQSDIVRGGGALKLRMSSTMLRYGEQRVKTPVFSSSDSRLLPETMRGWYLNSQEISDLTLQAGHFTGSTDRNSRNTDNDLTINYANPARRLGRAFDFLGGSYSGFDDWYLSLYTSELRDSWRTQYLGATYTHDLGESQSLSADLNLYRSDDTGRKLAGDISNTTGSLLLSYRQGMHKLGVGYQKVHGDTPFDYVTRGAIWLSNASQLSDFNAPNEQSWQLRYDADFTQWGVPGLTLGASYTRGSRIDGSKVDPNGSYAWLGYGKGGKHWERDLHLRYAVQQGVAKGMAVSLRYSVHRGNDAQAETDANQIKLTLEYPLSGGF